MPLALSVTSVFLRVLYVFMPGRIVRFVAGWERLGVDARLVGVATGIAAIAALVCGTVPAIQMAQPLEPVAARAPGG